MGKRKNGLRRGVKPFVQMTWEVLNSIAYRDLKPTAAKLLPYFIGKEWSAKQQDDNPRHSFEFSYREAERLGCAQRTFSDAITDLISKGFIDIALQGGLRGFCHVGSKYKLSERWRRFGQPGFEEIPRYPAEEPPSTPVRAKAKTPRDRAPTISVVPEVPLEVQPEGAQQTANPAGAPPQGEGPSLEACEAARAPSSDGREVIEI